MERLIQFSTKLINSVSLDFKRYLSEKINWENRLIVMPGARGTGKTTLVLQHIREKFSANYEQVMYASVDDLFFTRNNLLEFAEEFTKRGGKYLFLDEIHKYENWSQEVKNIYDYFPELKLVLTGSSALKIYQGNADLSRRAITYVMKGLSFREFIELEHNIKFPVLTLEELIENATGIVPEIVDKIKPVKLFEEYVRYGFYPFFTEGTDEFHDRLKRVINQVIESDLPAIEKIDFSAVQSLKKLLALLAEMAPFKPNISKLSTQVGVSRETLIKYLRLLANADLLLLLDSAVSGISRMNKPEKVYLNNANLMHAISQGLINQGTVRETTFFSFLEPVYNIRYSGQGDFLVDEKYTFEVGGKNKKSKQIKDITNSFIAADNVEYAHGNKIPLWLFGFLY